MIYRTDAVLFDMDGTLSDTIPDVLETFNRILARQGVAEIPDTTALVKLFGPTEEEILQRLLPSLSAAEIRQALETAMEGGKPLPCVADMTDVLQACKAAGRKVGVFTGAGRLFGSARLRRLGLEGKIDGFVAGDDVERRKPDPGGLLLLCRQMGVRPETSVYVGDSPLDIRCAKAAGAKNIAVTWGVSTHGEMAAENPDMLVDTVAELRHALCL